MYAVILSCTLLIFAVFQAQPVHAENCNPSDYADDSYRLMLDEFTAGQCFSGDNNQTMLGKQVNQRLTDIDYDDRIRALEALQDIQKYLQDEYIAKQGSQTDNASSLKEAIGTLTSSIQDNPKTPTRQVKQNWQLDGLERLPSALEKLDFGDTLAEDECPRVGDKNCDSQFDQAAGIVRAIFLVNAALDKYTSNYREEALNDRALRTAKWDSYYDDLTFQYPWELWANNYLLEHYDTRVVVDGNKLGFRDLPRSKLVFVHPDANLVYADSTPDNYKITLTVEAIGYESFKFDNETGKVRDPRGLSLLAAYIDHPDQNDPGWTWGLLFKYHDYSIGVTDNHDKAAVVFNINLSQKIFDVKQKSRRYYDEYKDHVQKLELLIDENQQGIGQLREIYLKK